MIKARYFFFLLILAFSFSNCKVPESLRKTQWTVDEVKSWSQSQEKSPSWYGVLLYQGSDSTKHYFISRVMDEWVWFEIKKSELTISDERPHPAPKDKGLGYYYVDPKNNFASTEIKSTR